MTIERSPHPVFAALWAVWLGNVIAATLLPDAPLYGLTVLLAFFALEVPAAAFRFGDNARDTLSELATWVQRNTSKHRMVGRGWNAALLAVVLVIGWLVGRTFAHYSGHGLAGVLLGVSIGGLVVLWLWDHFVNPEVHG